MRYPPTSATAVVRLRQHPRQVRRDHEPCPAIPELSSDGAGRVQRRQVHNPRPQPQTREERDRMRGGVPQQQSHGLPALHPQRSQPARQPLHPRSQLGEAHRGQSRNEIATRPGQAATARSSNSGRVSVRNATSQASPGGYSPSHAKGRVTWTVPLRPSRAVSPGARHRLHHPFFRPENPAPSAASRSSRPAGFNAASPVACGKLLPAGPVSASSPTRSA